MPSRTTPKQPPARRPPAKAGPPSKVWIGLLALVLIAGVIAVLASRGGDEDGTTVAGTEDGATGSTQLAAQETRPVRVSGTPLPRLQGQPDAATGAVIPTLEGAGFDGTPVSITADGRPKILVFVAHWCPHCQREVPRLAEHLRDKPLPADIDMVTVATGTSPDRPNYPPSKWLEAEEWPGPVLADSDDQTASAAFGLPSYPYFVAVDKDGKVVARTTGELTTDQFDELVRRARS